MKPLKSEKHHWWPRCVSTYWRAEDGKVGRINPNGYIVRSWPENFGVIRNAHHIKLDHRNERPSPWDTSFEKEFDKADRNFPAVIEWLASLTHPTKSDRRFAEQSASDDQIFII